MHPGTSSSDCCSVLGPARSRPWPVPHCRRSCASLGFRFGRAAGSRVSYRLVSVRSKEPTAKLLDVRCGADRGGLNGRADVPIADAPVIPGQAATTEALLSCSALDRGREPQVEFVVSYGAGDGSCRAGAGSVPVDRRGVGRSFLAPGPNGAAHDARSPAGPFTHG